MSARMISDTEDFIDDQSLMYGTALPGPVIHDRRSWDNHVQSTQETKSPKVTLAQFNAMSDLEKLESQALRRQYTAKLAPIFSKSYADRFDELLRVASTNIEMGPGVRIGRVITGEPTLGKSTLLTWFGRKYERRRRAIHRAQFGSDEFVRGNTPWIFTPAVYVTLDGTRTFKALLQSIAAFLSVPDNEDMSELKLKRRITEYANNCGTSLIMIDDIHYLDKRFVGVEGLNNELKKFMGVIPATFVYAGIDCENIGLFREWKPKGRQTGSQTDHRFGKIELRPFELPIERKVGKEKSDAGTSTELADVLRTFDDQCLLLRHEPNDLVKLVPYIMNRTSGYMGAIATLIKHGAAIAIQTGEEKYTKSLLDQVSLDNASEVAGQNRKKASEKKEKSKRKSVGTPVEKESKVGDQPAN